ncbi:MAG TPA: hypothetical protein VM802_28025 [Chitinophaga sp.]|uniref:hypothetical protein n=1 Tax=Chitinophaga sp. TaxID=1869181 RepID=UPI002BB25E8B|nr:hypothetical protein [Chitinophaga sp.]HVI48749.1 hypothetical protein [Chitinophaga sp.]
MSQQINVNINGELYALRVEPENYNGHKVYYILNDNIGELFQHKVPDHLVLMDAEDDSFVCSPKLTEMEGGYIVQQMWQAIKSSC